ncbi:acyl-[acyl-carrier-protein] thioesterase [Paludibacter sp. 221]|uniref:acyl-[acyl-carrier-protein] thioesterase n=1 Tax=Paludibacter sp. 221 TaxID=2302939 RepID=UPI0013D7965C|nr:acyl-ACP thioesterase domain-containing protein [Paludibacter sp. 221]NDV45647.1 acyl-[acyl-carrier-protein] thioesterase [Paludibacter sp. 221]
MHSLIGTYRFNIDAYTTDFRGKATLPLMSSFILQVATKHAEERGFGYSVMTAQNKAWVLSRMVIEMFEYPKNDDQLNVKTWVADANKLFTERCVSFETLDGKQIGFARTVWAAIDIETRRPTNVLELEGLSDYKVEQELPIIGARKIPAIKDQEPVGKFTIRYSDIDINGHLNSMKYIEHFIDMFDMEMFKIKDIRRFEINYTNEAYFGTRLHLYKKEETDSTYILEMKNEDVVISSSRVIWE